MILFVYCVKDRATDVFGTPMFLLANGQAVRSFTDEVNREGADNSLYQHPDDFDLYRLGEFDNATALFTCVAPSVIARGKDVSLKFMESN